MDRIDQFVPHGMTLLEMLEFTQPDPMLRRYAIIYIDDYPIPRHNWHLVRPKPGATVSIKVRATGGGGSKNPLRLILSLVVLAAAFVFAAPLGAALVGSAGVTIGGVTISATAIGGAIITAVGTLLVNAIAPPRPPKLPSLSGQSQESPTLFISGARNQANYFGPVPSPLGRHRMVPPYGAAPFTEILGEDQYLRLLFNWGYGPLEISDIKIGETPIAQFDGVEIETIEGTDSDADLTLYTNDVKEQPLSILLTAVDGYSSRVSDPEANELSVDLVFPQGLVEFDNSGNKLTRTVTVQIQYRLVGNIPWLEAGTVIVTEKKASAVRRGHRWQVLTKGQYEVRVRRITADSTSTQIFDQVTWTAFRTITSVSPVSFPHPTAQTAVRIKATDQLNQVVDQLNGVIQTVCLDWDTDTQTWIERATSNPASLFRHVLQGPANARPLADSRIDLSGLQEWHEKCTNEGREFNMIRDFASNVYDTLSDIAAAGRASVAQRDGKWGVVIDEERTTIVQHFTPRNSWGFSFEKTYVDFPHAFRVRFVNEDMDWRQDQRIVYWDGYDKFTATKFEGLEFPGVTNPDQIWKDGRFHHANVRYRLPEIYKLNTDYENLICTRGDRVLVSHPVMSVGLAAGRVKTLEYNVDGDAIRMTADEAVPMELGKSYGVVFRTIDGPVSTQVVTTPGEQTQLEFAAPISSTLLPAVGDLFSFGEFGSETLDCVVARIEPAAGLTARISLLAYSPEIFQAETGTVPEHDSGITVPPGIVTPFIISVRSDEDVLVELPDGTLVPRIVISLGRVSGSALRQYTGIETQFRVQGEELWSPSLTSKSDASEVIVDNVSQGAVIEFRSRYVYNGGVGDWTTIQEHTVVGMATPPAAPTRMVVEGNWLRWQYLVKPRDFLGFEVRTIPGSVPNWERGQRVNEGDLSASELSIENLPRGQRVYMVKAIDLARNESATYAYVVRDFGDLTVANVVLTEDLDAAGFPGSITGGTVTGGVLEADDTTDYLTDPTEPYLMDATASYLPSNFTEVVYTPPVTVPDSTEAPSRLTAQLTATGSWKLEYFKNGFVPQLTSFDGVDDRLSLTSGHPSAVDNGQGTLAITFERLSDNPEPHADQYLIHSVKGFHAGIIVWFGLDNLLRVYIRSGASVSNRIEFQSHREFLSADGQVTLLMSWDMSTEPRKLRVYRGHEEITGDLATLGTTFDDVFYNTTSWTIAGSGAGYTHIALGEFYLDAVNFTEIDHEVNRLKFVDDDGLPIFLGSDGSTPTGSPPLIYLSTRYGDGTSLVTNRGTGSDYVVEGAPTLLDPDLDEEWRLWPGYAEVEADDTLFFRWSALAGEEQGTLSNFDLVFDVPDESEYHGSFAIAATTGTRVALSKNYREITVVNATLHGGGTAVRVEISDKDAVNGPLLIARNSAGTAVAATVDVHIQGVKG